MEKLKITPALIIVKIAAIVLIVAALAYFIFR